MIDRRSFLRGVGAVLCAPAIVRISSLMAVRALPQLVWPTAPMPGEIYAELQALTRAAFIPKITAQIYLKRRRSG